MSKVLSTDFSQQQELSVLERQVLMQYQSLALKLHRLAEEIQTLHKSTPVADFQSGQATELLQNMRGLERKVGLVHTLFRTAVYSLLLQNEESRTEAASETEKGMEGL